MYEYPIAHMFLKEAAGKMRRSLRGNISRYMYVATACMRRSFQNSIQLYDFGKATASPAYRVQNLTVSKIHYQHFFRTEYSVGIPIDSTTILVPPTY